MARVVRKVSNKAVKGQKREKGGLLHSKKFWIILISIIVILTAAGITVGIIVSNNNKKTEETVEVDDYFGQTQKFKETDVNFEKMTYAGVKLHSNTNAGSIMNEYTFVFATDLSVFYPKELKDNDDNDLKDDLHEKVFNQLVELQYYIDLYNADPNNSEERIALYIVNTVIVSGNNNSNIYTDTQYMKSAKTTFLGPLFSASHDGEFLENNPDDETKSFYSEAFDDSTMSTAIGNAMNFVKSRTSNE